MVKTFLAIITLFFIVQCSPKSSENAPQAPETAFSEALSTRSRNYWPTTDWQAKSPQETGLDVQKLRAFRDYSFNRTGDDTSRKGIRSDGVVVIHKGYLVFEEYARGYDRNKPHLIWSDTKSVLNAAIGIAVGENKLAISDSAGKYIPQMAVPQKAGITLNHLLQMSSGLFWDEGYESSPLKSSVIAMLYTRGRGDMGTYAASLPVDYPPGERFYYSSGTSNIISLALKKAIGNEAYQNYFWDKIFNPLGMHNVTFEQDGAETYIASSYIYIPPREFAKFGYLYLNNGVWGQKQILPKGWVKYTVTMAPAYYTTPPDKHNKKDNPGAHWWLNLGVPSRGQEQPWPSAPRDAFAALGHWGQYLVVIPSLDIVVVRTGDDRDGSFNLDTFLGLLVKSVKK